jgi:hypothetical protein
MDDGRDIGGIEELGASGHKKGRAVSRYVRFLLISILVVIGLALAAILWRSQCCDVGTYFSKSVRATETDICHSQLLDDVASPTHYAMLRAGSLQPCGCIYAGRTGGQSVTVSSSLLECVPLNAGDAETLDTLRRWRR